MSRQTRWIGSSEEADAFAVGKQNAEKWFSCGGWVVGWDEPEAFDRIVSKNGGDGRVEAPAEIVQRHCVTGISETYGVRTPEDAIAFTVTLRAVSGPYGGSDTQRFFAVSKEQAQLFKVGSEIEVVLRPAPLA